MLLPLLLAGGRSTRMGQPKHLLLMPDGRHLYQHLLELLAQACPNTLAIYISLARSSSDTPLHLSASRGINGMYFPEVKTIYDLEDNPTPESAGPAAGLLAAHHHLPHATWLVLACDFPLMTLPTLQRVVAEYAAPVTCFRNAEGHCESLVGVWSPEALVRLARNCAIGMSGPSFVVHELGARTLELGPADGLALFNVNTEADWRAAMEKFRRREAEEGKRVLDEV